MQISELLERKNKRLKSLHVEFKRQIASIPFLWERNENLLRFLTSQNKSLTYAITTVRTPTGLISPSDNEKNPEKFRNTNENETSRMDEKTIPPRKENSQSAPPSYDSIEQV
jgi:hypothetical protein